MGFDEVVEAEKARRRTDKLQQEMQEAAAEEAQIRQLSDYARELTQYFGKCRLHFATLSSVSVSVENDGVPGICVTDIKTDSILGYVFVDRGNAHAHFETGYFDRRLFMIALGEFPETLKGFLLELLVEADLNREGP